MKATDCLTHDPARSATTTFAKRAARRAEPAGPESDSMASMNSPTSRLILTSEGFSPRPEDRTHADEKAAKVLRHTNPRVDLIRLHLKRETPHSAPARFT